MRLPGLIDIHVHMREPGATHKEDWDSGTAAALAGGFTVVLAMPNTQPPITDSAALAVVEQAAQTKARCDYGIYLGAGADNIDKLLPLADHAVGLKMYLDQTFGSLRLDDMSLWAKHLSGLPKHLPVVAHAEGRSIAAIILIASLFDHPIHLAHVSTKEEILLIRQAKEKGIQVTCEVCPHHLFLSEKDIPAIGARRSEVRPMLRSEEDRCSLWENLEVIDCFATDHAPHTLAEKDSPKPPPGYPGLETALPLFLTAIHEGKLTLDDVIRRLNTNPRRIFNIPEQPDTWIDVDMDETWEIRAAETYTRCGWTPFEGRKVRGRLRQVTLRGKLAFDSGKMYAQPGSGLNIRRK
ncbi:MAG: amidohydrolase family protein [Chloroflexi bacterium]|nr:amidohydrolase family protein [Chloroflexota bacterium]